MFAVHELLTRSASKHPRKEALVSGNRRFSYQAIESASNALASFLQKRGIGQGDAIGIFSNKDIEEVVAIFAIAKIGGVFVHINPHFKERQLAHVVSDCSLRVLIVNEYKAKILANAFPEGCPLEFVVLLSGESDGNRARLPETHCLKGILRNHSSDTPVRCSPAEDDVASIIYTSGSTGMPKGTIVTHKIFCDATEVSASLLQNTEHDRLISATPFSFDGSLSQLLTSFLVGGTLVLQQSNFPRDIVRTLLDERISGFHAVPSLWMMLLSKHSPFPKHRYPDLRYVSIIGEVFPEEGLGQLRSILDSVDFHMMYGTTEAFRSTCLMPTEFERKPSSVGRPLPGVEISIVNERGEACGPGETGEIVHRGLFVSPGYLNNEEVTRETFRGGGVYTGDLGRMDAEGFLYFVERKDEMIKISGFRVCPTEIEECLYQMPEVEESVVTSVESEALGTALKALICQKRGAALTESDVVGHCRKILPHYMVPAVVEFATRLPRTATGKINRAVLKNGASAQWGSSSILPPLA